jgi:S1-C subfamily serine protease
MRSPSVLIGWQLLVVVMFPCAALATEIPGGSASPSIAAQPNDAGTLRIPSGQPSDAAGLRIPSGQPSDAASVTIPSRQSGETATLELSPQPSDKNLTPDKNETSDQRAFRQSKEDEIARLNRNFHPHDDEDSHRPYLGLDLEYSTQCYRGMEEHGFEVVSVYPDSPAARAGLIGRTGSTPAGDLGALGSVLLGPVALVTFPLLRASGALGTGGDLIVAVDDVRVRTKDEILHELGHLKPGDTTYITVIRPLPGGYHRTMRIALHIDYETDAAGNKIIPPGAVPSAAPSVASESAAN